LRFIFLAAFSEFWEGSAICVTELLRIKKTVSKNLYKITGLTELNPNRHHSQTLTGLQGYEIYRFARNDTVLEFFKQYQYCFQKKSCNPI